MKATIKFYARPDSGKTTEVVPIISNNVDARGQGGINLRLASVGEGSPPGEFHVRMDRFEALSLAAEIVLKVARGKL